MNIRSSLGVITLSALFGIISPMYSFTALLIVVWRSLVNAVGGALAGLVIALVYNAIATVMGGVKLKPD